MAALAAPQPCHTEPSRSIRKRDFEALKTRLSAQVRPVLSLEDAVQTAIPELDRLLGGGLPSGAVATLEGATGRWSLAAGLAAKITRRGLVAILDDGTLYPPALAQAGVSLDRVLVVPARTALKIVRAVDVLLRSRICRLVVMPAIALRDVVWARLAQLAHRSGVLLIVMAERAGASLSAIAELRLHCALDRFFMHGTRGLWGSVSGFELCVDVRKHKHHVAGRTARIRVGHPELVEGRPDAALR
jgi:hypothetical protein